MTWHVVKSGYCSSADEDDAAVWTVSEEPNKTGWETDSGQDGYGLTKARARFLCDAANAATKLDLPA